VGRIVVGVQVPRADRPAWQEFLDGLGYQHWDESANPAYKLFLGPSSAPLPALA
jgi:threonine dehydratase